MRPDDRHRARFARFLRLYPRAHRARFAEPMEQAFADAVADRRAAGRPIAPLLVGAYLDTSAGIVRERIGQGTKGLAERAWLSALLGAMSVMPFLVLNLVVVHRIEPVFSFLRPGVHTGPFEYPVLFGAILLLFLGAAVALAPVWRRIDGPRRFPVANLVIATLLLAAFLILAIVLGDEIIRCEVAQLKNCD